MPNTLTDLYPALHAGVTEVSREVTGMLMAVSRDARFDRARKDQDVVVAVTQPRTAQDVTPGITSPANRDQDVENIKVQITKFRTADFYLTGEEEAQVDSGTGVSELEMNNIKQGIRTLVNEMEEDLAEVAYQNASRNLVAQSAGNPFASTTTPRKDAAQLRKLLTDNGCPNDMMRCLVMDTDAAADFIAAQDGYVLANESGDSELLRMGMFGKPVMGFRPYESAQLTQHTQGAGGNYLVNLAAGYAVGARKIAVDGGGAANAFKAGDVITFEGDDNRYVVEEGFTGASGTITLNRPGLLEALSNNAAITRAGNYTPVVACHKSAIVLATRRIFLPRRGDAAADSITITDPMTGISFEFANYPQYVQERIEVRAAWGVQALKPEWIGTMAG